MKHVPMHVSRAEVAPAIAVRQLQTIDAQKVEHSGVNIMHVYRLLNGFEHKIVSGAVDRPALHRSAGQPHREPEGIVIAAFFHAAAGAANYRMQTEAPEVFDVRKESQATLDMYGEGATARGLRPPFSRRATTKMSIFVRGQLEFFTAGTGVSFNGANDQKFRISGRITNLPSAFLAAVAEPFGHHPQSG